VVPFVLLVCACGAAVTVPLPSPAPSVTAAPSPAASVPAPAESFDDLSALAPTLAPGMSEIARKASTGDAVELLGAAANDACVRVAFAAESPVSTKLVDGSGEALAVAGPALQGALGERGPVCVRRGEIIRGVADGAGRSHVRWMAWQAP
jgi:hypothetical protein